MSLNYDMKRSVLAEVANLPFSQYPYRLIEIGLSLSCWF